MSQLSNSGRSRAQRLVPFGTLAAAAFLLCAAMWQAIDWGYNRVYVPEGKSLLLRYKGFPLVSSKPPAQPGHFARVDESGRRWRSATSSGCGGRGDTFIARCGGNANWSTTW